MISVSATVPAIVPATVSNIDNTNDYKNNYKMVDDAKEEHYKNGSNSCEHNSTYVIPPPSEAS